MEVHQAAFIFLNRKIQVADQWKFFSDKGDRRKEVVMAAQRAAMLWAGPMGRS